MFYNLYQEEELVTPHCHGMRSEYFFSCHYILSKITILILRTNRHSPIALITSGIKKRNPAFSLKITIFICIFLKLPK